MATVLEIDAKIDRILGDVADVAGAVADLRVLVEALEGRIAPEELDPLLAKLEAVEAGLDAIVPDPVVEPEPVIE
jgi:hypothetical protein